MSVPVFINPIEKNKKHAVKKCFDEFGGVEALIKGNVFIKMNNVANFGSSYTDLDLIIAIIKVIQEAKIELKDIYVMDNCTEGYFSRLIFSLHKFNKKLRKIGAIPLYLDEEKPILVDFNGIIHKKQVPIPKILYENLIKNREENTYINVPKLKTHMITKVTISLKNQIGLLYDKEKIYNHYQLDEKILDILNIFKPDFNIVDASTVINHGPVALYDDWIIPMGLLICGKDPVAVDTICCKLIGIKNVKHIDLASEKGFGCNDINKILIKPSKNLISQYKKSLSYKNPLKLPKCIRIFEGSEKACKAGCSYLDMIFQMIIRNNPAESCIGIYGKGHNTSDFTNLKGPFIINGPCAVAELKDYFETRKITENIRVFYINDHFNVAEMFTCVRRALDLKFSALKEFIPCSLLKASYLSFKARKKGVNYIPVK